MLITIDNIPLECLNIILFQYLTIKEQLNIRNLSNKYKYYIENNNYLLKYLNLIDLYDNVNDKLMYLLINKLNFGSYLVIYIIYYFQYYSSSFSSSSSYY